VTQNKEESPVEGMGPEKVRLIGYGVPVEGRSLDRCLIRLSPIISVKKKICGNYSGN
jgi:hypothetical protein